ncbi:hypothetical protein CSA37_06810 [Candidatus Fermentibacteria bacterium]|nr:MAG: hypothetical protein CSA37_06810 [Candidatus Fermentibacteria bacterium]
MVLAAVLGYIAGCCLILKKNPICYTGYLLLFAMMLMLHSNHFNQDGLALEEKFETAEVVHAVHDEMLELVLHFFVWRLFNLFTECTAAASYHIVSAAAGVAFFHVLAGFTRKHIRNNQLLFLLLVTGSGYLQLFYGDVENYTILAFSLMWYLTSSVNLIIEGGRSLLPSILLGIGMCLHLEAGFLLPAHILLSFLRFRKEPLHLLLSSAMPVILTVICMTVLDLAGVLPMENLWKYSHASAHGGNIQSVLPPLSRAYYTEIANLTLLLFPLVSVLPLYLLSEKALRKPDIQFLTSATGVLFLLLLGWKASLGVFNDWNLFAIIGYTGNLTVVYAYFKSCRPERKLAIPFLTCSLLNTFCWIWRNHAV